MNVKKPFAMTALIVYSMMMVACGKTADDAVNDLKAAAEAIKRDDVDNFDAAYPLAEKELNKAIKHARKTGDSAEEYKLGYVELLKDAVQYINDANNAIKGLKSARDSGAFDSIDEVIDADANKQPVSDEQRKLAETCREKITIDYQKALTSLQQAKGNLKACEKANVNTAFSQTVQIIKELIAEIEAKITNYSQDVQGIDQLNEGLGGSLNEALEHINLALQALQSDDTEQYDQAMKNARKCLKTTTKNAKNEEDSTTLYQVLFVEAVENATIDASEAKRGIDGLKGAEKTNSIQIVKDVRSATENGEPTSEEQNKIAEEVAERIFIDYTSATTNLYSARGGIEACEEATLGTNFTDTVEYLDIVLDGLSTDLDPFSIQMQDTFGLTDEEMDTLSATNAEPGLDSGMFIDSIKDVFKQLPNGSSEFDNALHTFKTKCQRRWNLFWDEVDKRIGELSAEAQKKLSEALKKAKQKTGGWLSDFQNADAKAREEGWSK